jgi:hypothetical protein
MTNSNKLQELVESVDKKFDEKFYMLPDNGFFFKDNIKTFLHQVILETVEVVGKELLTNDEVEIKNPDGKESAAARIKGRNDLRKLMRARLSQLMDSLKEKKMIGV